MLDYAIKKERESGGVGSYLITSVISAQWMR